MITREQVVDLRPGDVVRIVHGQWPEGSFCQGPAGSWWLSDSADPPSPDGALYVCGYLLRREDGDPIPGPWTLTVVEAVPRDELYVNHLRTWPEAGDVARDGTGRLRFVAPAHRERPESELVFWGFDIRPTWGWTFVDRPPAPLTLLVDGETGRVVTP